MAEESDDLSWPNPVRFKRHAGKVERRLPRDLRDEDVECVWPETRSKRDRAWFALMVRGGLRVGEVVTLKVSDIRLRLTIADLPVVSNDSKPRFRLRPSLRLTGQLKL